MNQDLERALSQFPIVGWLSKHTTVKSSPGSPVIYADCPICGGKKKLGVYRRGRMGFTVAVCGRCKDGGHHQGRWSGSTNLPGLVKLLERTEWRDVFRLIHRLAGVPEPEWKPREKFRPSLPDGHRLRDLPDDERSNQLLVRRGVGHLRDDGLLVVGGKYSERIILPTYYQGTLTGFEARATYPAQEPKSLFAPGMGTDQTLHTAKTWNPNSTTILITESVIDAETFHGKGVNAVGCFGAWKRGHLEPLLDLNPERVYWFTDADAWDKIWPGVQTTISFCRNYVVPMPDGEDPNSLGAESSLKLMEQAVLVQDQLDFIDVTERWKK